MDLDKKTIHKIAGLLAFAIILYLGLSHWNVVTGIIGQGYQLIFPFILGGCIAFVLNIPMAFFERHLMRVKGKRMGAAIQKWNKVISLLLSCLLIIAIVAMVLYIVIPQIIATAKILPETFHKSSLALQKWAENKGGLTDSAFSLVNGMGINWDSVLNSVRSTVFRGASSVISSMIGMTASFAAGIVNFMLGFVFAVYVLLQKKKLGNQLKKLLYAFLPIEKANAIVNVAALTSQTFSNFLTGQCIEAVIIGVMFFVTMMIFQFPYAMVISVVIGCTALIPILGPFIGCAVGLFLIVMVDPMKAVMFLILFLILQQIEGNLIYPRVVGNSVGLPSIWVLVAITIGGKMMGIAGMIIFIPLFSVAYVLLRREVYNRLKHKNVKIV